MASSEGKRDRSWNMFLHRGKGHVSNEMRSQHISPGLLLDRPPHVLCHAVRLQRQPVRTHGRPLRTNGRPLRTNGPSRPSPPRAPADTLRGKIRTASHRTAMPAAWAPRVRLQVVHARLTLAVGAWNSLPSRPAPVLHLQQLGTRLRTLRPFWCCCRPSPPRAPLTGMRGHGCRLMSLPLSTAA